MLTQLRRDLAPLAGVEGYAFVARTLGTLERSWLVGAADLLLGSWLVRYERTQEVKRASWENGLVGQWAEERYSCNHSTVASELAGQVGDLDQYFALGTKKNRSSLMEIRACCVSNWKNSGDFGHFELSVKMWAGSART